MTTDTLAGAPAAKTAVISGGEEHLAQIVARLAGEGIRVVLHAETGDEAAAAGLIAASDASVTVLHRPILSFADAEDLIGQVVTQCGRLDFLLTPPPPRCSAGLVDLDADQWHVQVANHQKRAVALARAASRHFASTGLPGRIVTFSSADTFRSPGVLQAATNAAMLSLTSAVAAVMGPRSVTANCVVIGEAVQRPAVAVDMLPSLLAWLLSEVATEVTGQFVFAAGPDVGVYAMPLLIESAHTLVRFGDDRGSGSVDELLAPLLQLGKA